jgi:hypothetical protein
VTAATKKKANKINVSTIPFTSFIFYPVIAAIIAA